MKMSLTMKRYWYLILIGALFFWVLVYYWTYRVISVNIWDKWEVTTDYYNIENTIDLFDSTQVHEIKILMTDEEYKNMIDTYANTSEKDWYKTDVIVDWVLVSDVWIRLKWNSSLWWMWKNGWGWPSVSGVDRGKKWWFANWDNMMWGFHGNMERKWVKNWFPWERNKEFTWAKTSSWVNMEDVGWFTQDFSFETLGWGKDMPFPWAFEWWSFWPWMMSGDGINYDSQLPLFIRFDKYVDQTYQWHTMISLRVGGMGSDATLLAEPYSYELYQEVWQPAPETSYGSVLIDWNDAELFIISELPEDKYYIQKWFGDDNGILYKAWNFVDFSYQWEDPTLYSDSFTQKTRVNDYDLSPLIRMLKFVTESDDEEFEEKIDNYIDVKSVLTLLAIDDFVWNSDSFGWMWSNYYLYYHLWEQRFYLLTWDQNLAFGGMWWGFGWGWWPWWMWGWFPWRNSELWTWENMWEMPDFEWFGFDNWEMPTPPDFQWWEMWWFPGWDFPWGDFPGWNNWERKWWFGNWSNTLKTRLLANEKFKAMYDEIYAQIEEIALNSDFSENFFSEWSKAFNDYSDSENLVSESSYSQGLEKLKSYLENKKS